MVIPYELLSQLSALLLTGNSELKEAELELLQKPGRKEKTMACIKTILQTETDNEAERDEEGSMSSVPVWEAVLGRFGRWAS